MPEYDLSRIRRVFADELSADESRLFALLEDFYREMAGDVLIGFFFDGKDLTHIAQKQGEFLLRAMGSRPTYAGKPPATAHLAMPPILAGHFDRRLRLLEQTLERHGVSPAGRAAWIEFESLFRESIQAR